MKENKPAYQKPSIELITMDSEGSLLLTASKGITISGHGTGSTVIGSGRPTGRQPSITGYTNGSTINKR